jgi:hypothetical protein
LHSRQSEVGARGAKRKVPCRIGRGGVPCRIGRGGKVGSTAVEAVTDMVTSNTAESSKNARGEVYASLNS